MSGYMHAFAEESDVIEVPENNVAVDTESEVVDYVFEGFDVEFSEKIALMPISSR